MWPEDRIKVYPTSKYVLDCFSRVNAAVHAGPFRNEKALFAWTDQNIRAFLIRTYWPFGSKSSSAADAGLLTVNGKNRMVGTWSGVEAQDLFLFIRRYRAASRGCLSVECTRGTTGVGGKSIFIGISGTAAYIVNDRTVSSQRTWWEIKSYHDISCRDLNLFSPWIRLVLSSTIKQILLCSSCQTNFNS